MTAALARAALFANEWDTLLPLIPHLAPDLHLLAVQRANRREIDRAVAAAGQLPKAYTAILAGAKTAGSTNAAHPLPGDWNGTTPLHLAAMIGAEAIIERLLAKGADADDVIQMGFERYTPLAFSIDNEHWDCAHRLLAAGADATKTDRVLWSLLTVPDSLLATLVAQFGPAAIAEHSLYYASDLTLERLERLATLGVPFDGPFLHGVLREFRDIEGKETWQAVLREILRRSPPPVSGKYATEDGQVDLLERAFEGDLDLPRALFAAGVRARAVTFANHEDTKAKKAWLREQIDRLPAPTSFGEWFATITKVEPLALLPAAWHVGPFHLGMSRADVRTQAAADQWNDEEHHQLRLRTEVDAAVLTVDIDFEDDVAEHVRFDVELRAPGGPSMPGLLKRLKELAGKPRRPKPETVWIDGARAMVLRRTEEGFRLDIVIADSAFRYDLEQAIETARER